MPTIVKENYLKALYFLDKKNSQINITALSKQLKVSKPTASNMVKSLKTNGWVIYEKYKPVQLTEKGRKAAAIIIRKHRLTEMFLHKVMGFGWEEVHEIAEQIEHINSKKLFTRMDKMLNYPKIDPHGSPIPDEEGNVIEQKLQNLININPGEKGRLSALAKSSSELLHYLNYHNIGLGTHIELIKIEPFDRSCFIRCDDKAEVVVSKKVAESLLIELFKD